MKQNKTASLEAGKTFWANPGNYTHFSREYWGRELNRCALDFSFLKDKNVCEIGSGPFGMIYYADAKKRIAVDPLISYYKELGLLPPAKVRGMSLINGGGENLSEIQSGSVDVVICFNVLDHVQHPEKVLLEARRILKDGAVLFLNCHAVGKRHTIR